MVKRQQNISHSAFSGLSGRVSCWVQNVNWEVFFKDEKGQESMSRLLCFAAFFPATYVVMKTGSSDSLAWYLAAYAASYVGGKGVDAWRNKIDKDHE